MSLFDVIKYGEIDIYARDSLETLPRGLLESYWTETGGVDIEPHITGLLIWALSYYSDNNDTPRAIFKRALERYNEPI